MCADCDQSLTTSYPYRDDLVRTREIEDIYLNRVQLTDPYSPFAYIYEFAYWGA